MKNNKTKLIKDTLGTREKYHTIITDHNFSNDEKDILLQASVNINSSTINQSLINKAYDILISKSIENPTESIEIPTKRKKSTTNSSYIKYLLIFGFIFVLFYIITPNKFGEENKSTTSKQKLVQPKQKNVVPQFGSISGQGFLRTQGGSIRTCAGNDVYVEKSNPNGLLYLSEILQNKKDHLESREDSLVSYKDWLRHSKDMLRSSESSLRQFPSQSAYYKEQVSYYKERVSKDKQRISEQKKTISSAKKVVQEYKVKVEKSIKDNILKTMCDAQGNYEFPKVALGKYYIRTVVQWYVGDEKQGGIISKTTNIQQGHNKIMLTE